MTADFIGCFFGQAEVDIRTTPGADIPAGLAPRRCAARFRRAKFSSVDSWKFQRSAPFLQRRSEIGEYRHFFGSSHLVFWFRLQDCQSFINFRRLGETVNTSTFKFLSALAASGLTGVGAATAADLPVKAPPLAAPAVYNWTGCYVGGNVGWNGSRSDDALFPTGSYLNPAGALAPPNAAGTGALAGDLAAVTHAYSSSGSAVTGGGQVGCNIQTGQWVFGGEADFNGSSDPGGINSNFGPVVSANPRFTISPETDVLTTKMDWFSTVRGRIGFAIDRVLVYATGGVVVADISSSTGVNFTTAGTSPVYSGAQHLGSTSTTRAAGVVGAGLEYAINSSWSIKAEYLYFDLGSFAYSSPLIAPAGAATGYAWRTNVSDLREQVVRVGVNYHFNWAGAALARY